MKNYVVIFSVILLIFGVSCTRNIFSTNETNNLSSNSINMEAKKAYFAGGCFWCMEGIFEAQKGVFSAVVGYAGGEEKDASYEKVSLGTTKHREAVEVIYDPTVISFDRLVSLYWTQIDPTDLEGQFADKGFQYTTAIYYQSDEEKNIAEESKSTLGKSKKFSKPIVTSILPFTTFFPAEEYHQDYYKKSSLRYSIYKKGSGREDFIKQNWGDAGVPHSKDDLKKVLTPIQYKVTQEGGTEKPFDNEYWDNHEEGIYVDIIDGTPLFSSRDKYESGTGWPSFTKPIDPTSVDFEEDNTLFSRRIEVRSKNADSHLGHVFDDGPDETGGKRYCMNSAALKFIPKDELIEKGYAEYLSEFE